MNLIKSVCMFTVCAAAMVAIPSEANAAKLNMGPKKKSEVATGPKVKERYKFSKGDKNRKKIQARRSR